MPDYTGVMRIAIVGTGAVGGTIGARLSEAGREVVFVARGAHAAAMREHGLRLQAPDGEITVRAPVCSIGELREIELVLLCVKTQQAAVALDELRAVTSAPVACLTNGLEAERLALRWFRDVHGVCVYTPATHLEPGIVQQWASPSRGILDVGRYPRGHDEVDRALAAAFTAAGYASEVRDDIMAFKRTKLVSNLSNAVEAMIGARSHPIEASARREAVAAYAAAGLSTTPEIEEDPRRARMKRGEIAGAMRAGGSTWQSVARGSRELECDYLNGEIALLGRLYGVATPANDRLQRLAAQFAREGRAAGSLPLAELE